MTRLYFILALLSAILTGAFIGAQQAHWDQMKQYDETRTK